MPIDTSKYLTGGSSSNSSSSPTPKKSKIDTSKYLSGGGMDTATKTANAMNAEDNPDKFAPLVPDYAAVQANAMNNEDQASKYAPTDTMRTDYPGGLLNPLNDLGYVANNPIVKKVGEIGRMFYVPGGGGANLAGLTGAAESAVSRVVPEFASSLTGRVLQKGLSEAIVGAPLGVGQSLMTDPNASGTELLKSAVMGAGLGAGLGAAGKYAGTKIGQALENWRVARNPQVEQQATDLLALPSGRGEQRLNTAMDRSNLAPNESPIAGQGDIYMPKPTEPLGLPEPTLLPPTQARVEVKPNEYTRKLENLFETANQQNFTPGKELEELQSLWSQMAGPKDPNLNDLIDLAYPKQTPKVNTGSLSRARELQQSREAAGVPNLVKSQADRYQTVTGDAGLPRERVGLRDPQVTATPPIRKFAQVEPVQPRGVVVPSAFSEVAAAANPIARNYAERAGQTFGNVAPRTVSEAASNPVGALRAPVKAANAGAIPVSKTLTRGNYKNQLEKGNFSPKLQQKISNADQSYERITNKESVATANENVKNLTAAESKFLTNESGGPDHIATGYRLMQKLDALGYHERALIVSDRLAKDLTKSGQTSQAAAILERLSPEGQLLNLVRTAERNGKTVTVADSVKFKELAAKVQNKSGAGIRENEFNSILIRWEKGENVGVDDLKKLSNYLSGAEKVVKPELKVVVKDSLPDEFKDVRKRDKIVSFLDDAEQAALARIASRKNRLNSLPLDEWKDHSIVVASQIAKGTIKAATHVEDLVKMFGEEIRPVATQVFQGAQKLITGVSRGAAEGNLNKAHEVLRRVSGEAQAEKAIVQETADHVKKLIADAKAGNLNPDDVQKLRDYSDEIANMLDGKPQRIPTQEEKFLQSVKALSKKIAQVENEKIPADQANREVSSLLRQITKIADEGTPALKKAPIDNNALSNIAHDVMEKTRPNPKPTTLQEKLVEKYIKQQEKSGEGVSPKDIDTLRELAKNVTRLSGDQRIDADIAMQKILNSYEKSSLWDKTLAIRYMSMLLNTGTQAINATSGPIMATTGYVADVFGTMIDIAMHNTLKTPRTTTLYGTNPLKFMTNWFKGVKVGGKAGWEGVNPAGIQSTNEIRGLAFKSLYNPLGLAERTLGAVSKGPDFATYSAVHKSEMLKQAFLDAKNKGIKGKANIDNHIQQFINDPPEEALLQADRIGKNTTFQRSDTTGGKVANWLNSSPSLAKPVVNSAIPFVKTPINMASAAVTMTPAGIVKGLFQLTSKSKASQREAIRTLSLGITGTGISAVGYYLYNLGIITGANDSGDKNVDAIKEQAGQGKYRFNQSGLMRYMSAMLNGEGSDAAEKAAKYQEGDHAFDYNKLQPLAFPLAIGAGLGQNKDKPLLGKLGSAGSDAYGSLYGMSTLKGVQDIFQPSYGGTVGEKALGLPSRVAESFFKSFSPGGLAQEARRQDPVVRKTPYNNGIIDDVSGYFKSRTPGLSQSMPASKTTLGMDKMNAPGTTGQYANPYKSEVAAYSNAAVMISDLIDRTGDKSLAPAAPDKKITGKDSHGNPYSIAIPADRYDQLQEEVGHSIIAKITALPQGLTDAKKAERIKQIYSDVHAKERDKVKQELVK